MNITTNSLTSGRLLAKNSLWNLLGQVLPLGFGLLVIPSLIHTLGTARFGILTLSWALIGYSSLFDLGLGRALTKLVAERTVQDDQDPLLALVWTGLFIMLVTGFLGAIILAFAAPWIVSSGLHLPPPLRRETLSAFLVMSASIPIVVLAAGLRGVLEAKQLFLQVSFVRTLLGASTFLGPWIALKVSDSLVAVMLSLAIGRLIALILNGFFVIRSLPCLLQRKVWEKDALAALLKLGGWMTVTNVVGPIMVNMDRFLLGALVSVSAVAYYATPYEIVTKLWLVPTALAGVLFPAFSTAAENHERVCRLLDRAVNYILLVLFPACLLILSLSYRGLKLWLGQDFAQNSSFVLQVLTLGVLVNSLAFIPFALIQGVGRPDLTAKLHSVELLCYLPVAVWLIRAYGVRGAAIAWLARMLLDALCLFFLMGKLLPNANGIVRRILSRFLGAFALLTGVALCQEPLVKWSIVVVVSVLFLWCAWVFLLGDDERQILMASLKPSEVR